MTALRTHGWWKSVELPECWDGLGRLSGNGAFVARGTWLTVTDKLRWQLHAGVQAALFDLDENPGSQNAQVIS